jgi:hypothetical protein
VIYALTDNQPPDKYTIRFAKKEELS